MAALPQCIQAAKDLYDLRSRYKDAAVLITAIYSESMVIAASLSQVQNLMQHDALQNKPQLLETFDSALTGCRVVYGCLEEEVRELVAKTEKDDLKFKDRAKFLWKEATFKELLTQIRGQQSALSLLIQGLQMESIADIRKLVTENKATLNQVMTRSRTLRQSHPRLQVPESIFNQRDPGEDAADANSILKSTEFTFDDEVVNSKAYRRAMAFYTSQSEHKTPPAIEQEIQPEGLHLQMELSKENNVDKKLPITPDPIPPETRNTSQAECLESSQYSDNALGIDIKSAEHTSDTSQSYPTATATSIDMSEKYSLTPVECESIDENVPPLPPRRPSGFQQQSIQRAYSAPNVSSLSLNDSTVTPQSPSILSQTSTNSSFTAYEPMALSRRQMRKPLPLRSKVSQDVLSITRTLSFPIDSPADVPPLENNEMHAMWLSLRVEEYNFVERMTKLRKSLHDNIIKQWPLLEQHIEAIIVGEQLAKLSQESLIPIMDVMSEFEGATCNSSIFEIWTTKAHKIYREYCQRLPHAISSFHTTEAIDAKFIPFVNTVGLSLAWFGKSWEDYIKLPITHLDFYITTLEKLQELVGSIHEPAAYLELARLKRAIAAVQWLKTLCTTLLEEAQKREDVQDLEKRIHTMDSVILSQLNLLDTNRQIMRQGSMAIKLKGQGLWVAVHVVLLDNYLFWGKVKPHKKVKGDRIFVFDTPISVDDLEILSSAEQYQFQKATVFDEIPRNSVVYTIAIKNRMIDEKPHLLGAFGFAECKAWMAHLLKKPEAGIEKEN